MRSNTASKPAKSDTEEKNHLRQFLQLVDRQFHVAQDCSQQTRANGFAGMDGNGNGPAIRMFEEEMTSAGSVHGKARSFEGADQFSSLEAWKARPTVTC